MASWQMKFVKPQDIVVKDQVRQDSDPKKQEELNASVKAHGILQPLLVMATMLLLAGHRRLIAALAAGLETVPVIITDRLLSDSEIRVIQLTENMHRADLKPIEQVEGVEEVARLNPEMTNKDLAKLLGFDASMITRLRSAAKVIPSVREAFAVGQIGLSTVYAISKCESPADQEQMLAQALSGASRDAIEQAGRKSRNRQAPSVKVARVKCTLPSGINVVVSGEGVSLDESIEALTEAIKEMKRARDLGYTAKTFAAAMKDKSKKG